MQLQTTSPESKFPNEYTDVTFIQIDQHLKKLLPKYEGVPILWNTMHKRDVECNENANSTLTIAASKTVIILPKNIITG